jgi:hypothetical protein
MEIELVKNNILQLRGQRVMLDFHLAAMYGVETRILKQAVKRNITRFPDDFMFQLTRKEWTEVITNCDNLPQNTQFRSSVPSAFTEQGVAMLSSVLRSEQAVQVNIAIMRAFVLLRQHLTDYQSLKTEIGRLEQEMNIQFADINQALAYLLSPAAEREPIGFGRKQVA